jgi:hypothetical protein
MSSTFRSVLGAAIMAVGSLVAVLIIENRAFASDSSCGDNGCIGLGGLSTRDCSALDGQAPCTPGFGVRCSCTESPYNNVDCYCNGSVS